ncbi:unnamed protein product [Gadus morhua 'NCC']
MFSSHSTLEQHILYDQLFTQTQAPEPCSHQPRPTPTPLLHTPLHTYSQAVSRGNSPSRDRSMHRMLIGSIIGTASVSGIVSEREGDNTEEQESAVGGEEDDDAGEGPSAAGHLAAPTPSAKRQSAGRVLTDAVLQLQRETIAAVNNLTEEMRQIRNVITEIATTLKYTVEK